MWCLQEREGSLLSYRQYSHKHSGTPVTDHHWLALLEPVSCDMEGCWTQGSHGRQESGGSKLAGLQEVCGQRLNFRVLLLSRGSLASPCTKPEPSGKWDL